MKNSKRTIAMMFILTVLVLSVFITGCNYTSCTGNTDKATPDQQSVTTTAEKSSESSVTEATAASEQSSEKASENTNETQKSNSKATEPTTGGSNTTPTEKNTGNSGSSTSSKPSGTSNSGNSGSNSGGSNSGGSSTSSKPSGSGSSGGSGNSGGNSTSSKTWHDAEYEYIEHPAEYKDVWVVDQEAYSYEEPVYETQYRTICNQCGTDITGWVADHMQANEGSCWSYRSSPVKVQTGTQTVYVDEVGHWERQKVNDAWTEKRLVREAGYY